MPVNKHVRIIFLKFKRNAMFVELPIKINFIKLNFDFKLVLKMPVDLFGAMLVHKIRSVRDMCARDEYQKQIICALFCVHKCRPLTAAFMIMIFLPDRP
jgi:hypothetical protein